MSGLPELHGTVLWLRPDPPGTVFFRKWISRLATTYNSPVFAPHVTLSRISDSAIDTETANNTLLKLADRHTSLFLDCLTVECRDKPYQKIVIKTDDPVSLSDLHKSIDYLFGEPFSKKRDPHLSLLYNTLPCTVINKSLQPIKQALPARIHMSEISMVSLAGAPAEWKVVSTISLQR